jgi:protein gp37
MGTETGIEWCDHTFNPWSGCTRVSPGCDNCYAATMALRAPGTFGSWEPGAPRKRTSERNWKQPLAWNRAAAAAGVRRRVFCASLADVFDNQVPEDWRADLFHLIARTDNLDWLLLTKRPQNIAKMLPQAASDHWAAWGEGWPNVWLGTTAENQAEADRRIPHLLAVPAKVRFLSCEPLLGPVDLRAVSWGHSNALHRIDWVIAGGESGAGARPMHPAWARRLRDQCDAAVVPFFFKQWGEWTNLNAQGCAMPDPPRRGPGPHKTDGGFTVFEFDDGLSVGHIGKKAAGALLDGREHKAFPA